jgi:uncharacterized protein with ParB-like and HNH nuclease domain
MAYSDTSIRIHLINSDTSKNADDTITIRKNFDTNEFDIVYRDQNNGEPVTHEVSGLYRARVLDYLYMLFKNQALDEEGYKSVQLTLPALPRLIVSGDKFKDLYYREHFLEAVGTGLDLLDNTESIKIPKVRRFSHPYAATSYSYETPVARRSTAPGVRPQHLYFDE